MAKKTKSRKNSKGNMENSTVAAKAQLKRRIWVLATFTFLPVVLVYGIGFLWLVGYDLRLLWYAICLALVMNGLIGEKKLRVSWGELIHAYLNYLVLLVIGVLVALGTFNWWLLAQLVLIFTVLFLVLVAGIWLRKWLFK
ncbi:MAG: hypothetical protein FH749_01030 [Firmicutes bacterium]|nr:hypothetical protein [Bacillota bacterium]